MIKLLNRYKHFFIFLLLTSSLTSLVAWAGYPQKIQNALNPPLLNHLEDLSWPKTRPFEYKNFEYKNFEYKNFEYKNFEYKNFEYKNFEYKKPQKNTKFNLAIAYSEAARAEGLMNKKINDQQGMLFAFEPNQENLPCFWMKNTPQDLSLNFLDQKGKVLQKEVMRAYTTNLHCAKQPVYYAVELTTKAGEKIEVGGYFKAL